MEKIIKEIIEENIPDAVCVFDGDSCNLKLTVTSNTFKELKLIDQHKIVLELLCLTVKSVISKSNFIYSSTITLLRSPLMFLVAFSHPKETSFFLVNNVCPLPEEDITGFIIHGKPIL